MKSTIELSPSQLESVLRCEKSLKYEFTDKSLLFHAITHASIAHSRLLSYERLEFLGDSILGFVVCELLFQEHSEWLEGDLTKIKSNVVSRQSCAEIGKRLNLDKCLVVGKGVGSHGSIPKSLLANAFESIVAAIYLDGGMNAAKSFLLPLMDAQVSAAIQGHLDINYKSELQQYSQKRFGQPPRYQLLSDRGPDHEKWFQVAAQIEKRCFEPAWGQNKKEAEQRAAANALAAIDGKEPAFTDEPDC